jgi:hypothetical protein
MTTEQVEFETIAPESFLEPRRYRVAFQCAICGHGWSRIYKSIPKVDPPCPNKRCAADREIAQLRAESANLKRMLSEQKAPGHIGDNNLNKAWDITQNIVAQDYGVTNLNDRPYEGENMVAKQPPKIQAAIDNFFSGPKSKPSAIGETQNRQSQIQSRVAAHLTRKAIAGAYRGMAVPPTAIAPGAQRGRPALVHVGTKRIGG